MIDKSSISDEFTKTLVRAEELSDLAEHHANIKDVVTGKDFPIEQRYTVNSEDLFNALMKMEEAYDYYLRCKVLYDLYNLCDSEAEDEYEEKVGAKMDELMDKRVNPFLRGANETRASILRFYCDFSNQKKSD